MHTIRKGEPRDIAAIAVIYDRILDREERGRASTGWIRGVYPTADTARAALEAGELFVMEREGRVVVAGRINHEQCPQYAAVPWTEPETPDEQVLVLHTLVSDPLVAGHGCGTEFVAFYEQYARSTAAPGSGSTRTRATSPRAACTPASAIVRWTSYRASSTASPMCSLSAWKSASDPPQYPFRRPRQAGLRSRPRAAVFSIWYISGFLWICSLYNKNLVIEVTISQENLYVKPFLTRNLLF